MIRDMQPSAAAGKFRISRHLGSALHSCMSIGRAGRLLVIAALAAVAAVHASEVKDGVPPPSYGLDWQILRYEADQFTVRLPPEWLEIPHYNMSKFIGGAAAHDFVSDQPFSQNYRHGFQEGPIKEWFRPPYCLVDLHTKGRVTRDQLDAIPEIDRALPRGGPFREDGSRGVFSLSQVGTFAYEPAADIV